MRTENELTNGVSRRGFLAISGGLLVAGGLAACSSSGGSTASAPTDAATVDLGKQLRSILGTPKNLLAKGPGDFKTQGHFPISGADASGKQMTGGFTLGSEHISAWTNGKLNFKNKYYDNKSGDPQLEAAAARQAGLDGTTLFTNSNLFGFGACPPFIQRYQMFALDAGGGTGPVPGPFAGQKLCYGTREPFPVGQMDGLVATVLKLHPDVKRFVFVNANVADNYNNAVHSYMKALCSRMNIEFVDWILAPTGGTDYSATVQQVKNLNPDVTVWTTFGMDAAYQARAAAQQGLKSINLGIDYTASAAQVGGEAYKTWYQGLAYPDNDNPENDWAKLIHTSWVDGPGKTAANGAVPGNYVYNYYQAAFMYAILMDRAIGMGLDIHKGESYVKALEADPTFPHPYGGSGSKLGQLVIDTSSHSPSAIDMLCFQPLGTGNVADIKVISRFNMGGKDLQML